MKVFCKMLVCLGLFLIPSLAFSQNVDKDKGPPKHTPQTQPLPYWYGGWWSNWYGRPPAPPWYGTPGLPPAPAGYYDQFGRWVPNGFYYDYYGNLRPVPFGRPYYPWRR